MPDTSPVNYLETPGFLTGHIFERADCPIHYWTGGREERPAVACVHGALMDHRMFNAQLLVLAEAYRILTWDARGQGKSQPIGLQDLTIMDYVEDAIAMLDHAGVEKAVLIGQSLGAYIAQHVARIQPERVLALVVIGSTPIAFTIRGFEMWALQASAPLFGLWPYHSLKQTMAHYTAIKKDVQRYALAAMNQVDKKTFLAIWKAVSTAVRREGYPDFRIEAPFLLTHGDRDRSGTISLISAFGFEKNRLARVQLSSHRRIL